MKKLFFTLSILCFSFHTIGQTLSSEVDNIDNNVYEGRVFDLTFQKKSKQATEKCWLKVISSEKSRNDHILKIEISSERTLPEPLVFNLTSNSISQGNDVKTFTKVFNVDDPETHVSLEISNLTERPETIMIAPSVYENINFLCNFN